MTNCEHAERQLALHPELVHRPLHHAQGHLDILRFSASRTSRDLDAVVVLDGLRDQSLEPVIVRDTPNAASIVPAAYCDGYSGSSARPSR